MYSRSRNSDRSKRNEFELDCNAQERLNQLQNRAAAKTLGFSSSRYGQFSTAAPRHDNGIEPSSPILGVKHPKHYQDTSQDDSLSIKDISRDYCGF